TLTTVWLGANDLLKYIFSAGTFGPTPTASLQADIQTTVQTLQAAGSQVVIANLPNVLHTALFIPIANLGPALVGLGVPAAAALPFAGGVAAVNNLGPGSYVLFSALGPIIAALPTGKPPVLTPGSQVVPAAFAAGFQAVNDAYNAAIATVASATGAPLVDDRTALDQAAAQGVPVNPPKCCSSVFGGGLFSFDGIHPSNTGYAIIANLFIGAINAKWGTSIPPVNVQAVYATDPYAPH
ncbi:MAG: hypothetical protein JO101_02490, partial [Candidatus Eremiobacteraeota bacterium]|nr:hypothetical protein [Candidatus Eremiobacteraeota bacterium]